MSSASAPAALSSCAGCSKLDDLARERLPLTPIHFLMAGPTTAKTNHNDATPSRQSRRKRSYPPYG
jgi:hypothetical protein